MWDLRDFFDGRGDRGRVEREEAVAEEAVAVGTSRAEEVFEQPTTLTSKIRGYYPFPHADPGVLAPLKFLFRDTHQAITVRSSGGGRIMMDFMTAGGQVTQRPRCSRAHFTTATSH